MKYQRLKRQMVIGKVDKKTTSHENKRIKLSSAFELASSRAKISHSHSTSDYILDDYTHEDYLSSSFACRLRRLYVSEVNPSQELHWLIHFIITNYDPNWFTIKFNWRSVDGPKNIFQAIVRTRLLSS